MPDTKKPIEEKTAKTAPVSEKLSKIISEIEKLSVLELADLVKALEEKFGVSAAMPIATAPATATTPEEPKEEQTVFNVVLLSTGANKISVIKALRELVPTLGLVEAKNLVDSAPKEIITQVNKVRAEEAKKRLETAGAKVELK